MNTFVDAMDIDGPPGITHPLLVENYAWVDIRLEELYYSYAVVTDDNNELYDEELGDEELGDEEDIGGELLELLRPFPIPQLSENETALREELATSTYYPQQFPGEEGEEEDVTPCNVIDPHDIAS